MQTIKPLALLAAGLLVACGGMPTQQQSDELRLLLGEIKAREQVLDKRQALLDKRGAELARLELRQEDVASGITVPQAQAGNAALAYLPAPAGASAQQCFRLARLAPRLSAEPQKVLVQDAADQIVVSEAQFESELMTMVVDYQPISAEQAPVMMRQRQQTIELRPAYPSWQALPAQFSSSSEPILSAPAHDDFVPCQPDSSVEQFASHWCAQAQAAQYQSIEHRRLAQQARAEPITVPAVTTTVTVREPVNAADKASLQPRLQRFEIQRLISAATYRREVLAPEYKTVTVKQLTRPAALAWREVLCQAQIQPALITQVQDALNARGYEAGEADGALGEKTLAAIAQFRRERQWPELGADISLELLQALELAAPK